MHRNPVRGDVLVRDHDDGRPSPLLVVSVDPNTRYIRVREIDGTESEMNPAAVPGYRIPVAEEIQKLIAQHWSHFE